MTWESRVRALEAEGLTRSDAQAVVDAEDQKNTKSYKAGLLVFVYRPGSDCTNGGVTSEHDRAILAWGKGPEIFTPSDTAPLLELQERCGRKIAVPVNDPRLTDGKHSGPMFGGNFVYTSDSRFPNEYPIPVHDRFET